MREPRSWSPQCGPGAPPGGSIGPSPAVPGSSPSRDRERHFLSLADPQLRARSRKALNGVDTLWLWLHRRRTVSSSFSPMIISITSYATRHFWPIPASPQSCRAPRPPRAWIYCTAVHLIALPNWTDYSLVSSELLDFQSK